MTGLWLREDEALAHIAGVCFKTGPPRRTGVELEWLVRDQLDPLAPVPVERLRAALAQLGPTGELPNGGRITLEPGGQVELSSRPATSPVGCLRETAADLADLRAALGLAGLVLEGRGLEPYRSPERVLDLPRYRAMEAYFDAAGHWGRMMMRATASVQVNVDAGEDTGPWTGAAAVNGHGTTGYRFRWTLVHRLGPVLVAAFANSPLWQGIPSGWRSTRQAVWAHMDPGRTRPPEADPDPRAAWARYALDARLLCLRRPEPAPWTAPPDTPLRSWLRDAASERRPTLDDAEYHLTTLFPPVRPRGWLELRMIDAQCGDTWMVPTLLVTALLDDPVAARAAYRATEALTGGAELPPWPVWLDAARHGPSDPVLGAAARACFDAASDALARSGVPEPMRRAVADFARRYPQRGRCPADDQLDALGLGLGPRLPEGASR
ncbi:ergothioneine biosynthesis glutamate--cysteine ligase EgtA [Streptacidiphilus sp. P02-A3a]|uniref:ergothioneine biosynthesis glutamate--cysteine ligase EgtA n=1 Tax=Streptacidiphilus sp. P02-A3a TaxID=2704468 RepID=UPI0015F99FEA|nr:ergothioneine biosynthesis glutamate--cysteine ligase EgtA [Streptacidiphilus sp. P02-A3a]QMU70753.1 ergothioneine biosynthesis glutamate--cysteine ligase EgtA [Streptacidiphilus sp. P02-A3a]